MLNQTNVKNCQTNKFNAISYYIKLRKSKIVNIKHIKDNTYDLLLDIPEKYNKEFYKIYSEFYDNDNFQHSKGNGTYKFFIDTSKVDLYRSKKRISGDDLFYYRNHPFNIDIFFLIYNYQGYLNLRIVQHLKLLQPK